MYSLYFTFRKKMKIVQYSYIIHYTFYCNSHTIQSVIRLKIFTDKVFYSVLCRGNGTVETLTVIVEFSSNSVHLKRISLNTLLNI